MASSSPAAAEKASGTPASKGGSAAAKNRSPTRAATPSTSAPSGVQRTRSTRGSNASPAATKTQTAARSNIAAKRASRQSDDDGRAESAALIEDLKAQLKKAEDASEEYQKQLYVAQTQLDEARGEQVRMEEVTHMYSEKLEVLERSHQEVTKNQRDLESRHEKEKQASEQDKEQAHAREEELQNTIHRLKESLAAHREPRKSIDGETLLSRSTSFRGRSSPRPPPDSPLVRRDSSQSSQAQLVLQKDKVIEGLRLELAEAQIKLVELENAGGGHVQELEKMLLEARMSNAKLLEDNELPGTAVREDTER